MPPIGYEHSRPIVPEKTPEAVKKEKWIVAANNAIWDMADASVPKGRRRSGRFQGSSVKAVYDVTGPDGKEVKIRAWTERVNDNGSDCVDLHSEKVERDPKDDTKFVAVAAEGQSRQFSIYRGGPFHTEGVSLHPGFSLDEQVGIVVNVGQTLDKIGEATELQAIRDL